MKRTLDFIVIGAQKAGTTSLFEHLRYHPELQLPARKEAPYFSHDTRWARDWTTYLADEFGTANLSCKWGTVTPAYMVGGVYEVGRHVSPGTYNERTVPERIRARLPDVRLIAILRDPVERAESHYKMMLMDGRETRTFDDAVNTLLRPDVLADSRRHPAELHGYVTWGEYGRILSGYFDVFAPEQMLILFTHDLRVAPGQLLRRIYDFLGVGHEGSPNDLTTKYREGSTARRFAWLDAASIQESLARSRLTRAMWHTAPPIARRWADRRYEQISYQLDLWNRRRATADIPVAASTVERLREHFLADTSTLATLMGRTPPWAILREIL